jgi:hypothetical protein
MSTGDRFSRSRRRPGRPRTAGEGDGDFRCQHCRRQVLFDPLLSGVNNRNHCPFCLWSRHVDEFNAGDRLAACKAGMRPIGLTVKRIRNKYARQEGGELMLIHACTGCDRLSINRIAADDDTQAIFDVFEASLALDEATLERLRLSGIEPLTAGQAGIVRTQLLGKAGADPGR